jgi:hypothetical protein
MIVPADKNLLADYRADLRTPDAPQMIDTEQLIMPVKPIGVGFPKPNNRQRLRYALVHSVTQASTSYQVATVTNALNIYLVGIYFVNDAAATTAPLIFDATSGNGPSVSNNTLVQDEGGYIIIEGAATIGDTKQIMLPLPLKMKTGIRINLGAVAQTLFLQVWYIEEDV